MGATGNRHLLTLRDLSDADLVSITRRGVEIAGSATGSATGSGTPLRDQVVGIFFSRTSTRTRTAFTTAALRLGARVVTVGPDELQLATGESFADTARVLGGMVDTWVIRTAGPPAHLRAFAAHCRCVVNAMTADEHPTQALADLTTMTVQFGRISGLRVLYIGEGNNTAAALALALPRLGAELELRTPPGYGLAAEVLATAAAQAAPGGRIRERHDLAALPDEVDVVYTTRWQTTGTTKPDPRWREVFAPFRVDGTLMARYPTATFMHDLPAHRGEEVTAEVLDGPASVAFAQARHKLDSAMAVLEWCAGARAPSQRPG